MIYVNEKQLLRNRIKYLVTRQTEAYRKNADAEIFKRIVSLPEFIKASRVSVYISIEDEVNTDLIIQDILKHSDKSLFFPRIDGMSLVMCQATSIMHLVKNKYNIPEPPSNISAYGASYMDCMIIPGCVFDLHGNRIGRGKGYYDKYLSGTKTFTIGLSYDCQIVDSVPVESWDVKLDMIVSESHTSRTS
jgi:5-formyltetrahydrofolate cyclo-ligase